jgi:SAM-dependent methyltransferase
MKKCLSCCKPFNALDWICPLCGWEAVEHNNVISFLDQREMTGFDRHFFPVLYELEQQHFWFTARNELIVFLLKRYFRNYDSFLEIGCGTGFVLSRIVREFPQWTVTGSEFFLEGLNFAQQRCPTTTFYQMDACSIPFVDHFDGIGVFDVLEHTSSDQTVLQQIYSALRPGGKVLITVPQHQFLWSRQDEISHHQRRYQRKELLKKCEETGFRIEYINSFVVFLLPAMLLSRLSMKKRVLSTNELDLLRIGSFLNKIFLYVMKLEIAALKAGVSFPCGGTLVVVASKRE